MFRLVNEEGKTMSRIGKIPISIPQGVEVAIQGDYITISGKKGSLGHKIPTGISVIKSDKQLVVQKNQENRKANALYGLTRNLLANKIKGVTEGFEKRLELVGIGYRANIQGSTLNLSIGFSKPLQYTPPEGISLEVERNVLIRVAGIDKEKVGQVAAEIRSFKKPEPYLGKGIKYSDEKVRRKVGKSGA